MHLRGQGERERARESRMTPCVGGGLRVAESVAINAAVKAHDNDNAHVHVNDRAPRLGGRG
jgi:hypothetical protein